MNDYLISYYYSAGEAYGYGNMEVTSEKMTLSDLHAIKEAIKIKGKELYGLEYEGVIIINVIKLYK